MVMQYASITDAWDNISMRKQSKKKKMDPSCDLVKQKYGSNEPSQVMNTYFDDIPYEKYERVYKSSNRERKDRHVDIRPSQSFYDVSSADNGRYNVVAEEEGSSKCKGPVQPYGYDEYDTSYDFDQYFEMSHKPSSSDAYNEAEEEDDTCVAEERHLVKKPMTREEMYRDLILEKYGNMQENHPKTASSNGWMEMVLYIFSGIILIIFMEQILNLGLYLK